MDDDAPAGETCWHSGSPGSVPGNSAVEVAATSTRGGIRIDGAFDAMSRGRFNLHQALSSYIAASAPAPSTKKNRHPALKLWPLSPSYTSRLTASLQRAWPDLQTGASLRWPFVHPRHTLGPVAKRASLPHKARSVSCCGPTSPSESCPGGLAARETKAMIGRQLTKKQYSRPAPPLGVVSAQLPFAYEEFHES